MILRFKAKDNVLLRLDNDVIFNKKERLSCNITFSKSWSFREKFVIFRDSKRKSEIFALNKDSNIIIPQFCLKDSFFTIQIYENDKFQTQECKVILLPEGYTIEPPKEVMKKRKKKCNDKCGDRQLFNIAFSQLQNKIDDIQFNDGYLQCYSDGKILHQVPIFEDLTQEIRSNIRELLPHFEVDEDGNLYAIYP